MSCPIVLTIAGSDNSCGAGIQADLKTIHAHGCFGLTAVTAVVAEVPGKVVAIQAMPTELIQQQIELCFETFPIAAVKTGMLFSSSIIEEVAHTLEKVFSKSGRPVPLVIDPVMVASSGDALLEDSALRAYKTNLFPLATLITPNLKELSILSDQNVESLHEMQQAGESLYQQFQTALLLKGGHLPNEEERAIDCLVDKNGTTFYKEHLVYEDDLHGTGCTYSAAITSRLALGNSMNLAITHAKRFITQAIEKRLQWGKVKILNI